MGDSSRSTERPRALGRLEFTSLLILAAMTLAAACTPPPSTPGGGSPSPACAGLPEDPAGGVVQTSYSTSVFGGATIYPACAEEALGTVMYVHGGGYTGGSRTDGGWPAIQELRRQGWVVVSIDYALSPYTAWPGHADDVRRAITWWRQTGAATHAAPVHPLVGVGWSAGGHIAEWVTVEDSGPRFDAAISISGATYWPSRPTSAAAVSLFGPVCCQQAWRLVEASTLTHLDPADPPLLHVHAENDGIVAVDQAVRLQDAIASGAGDPGRHEVAIDPTCGHSADCLTPQRFNSFVDQFAAG